MCKHATLTGLRTAHGRKRAFLHACFLTVRTRSVLADNFSGVGRDVASSRAFPLLPTWSHFPRRRRSPIFRLAQNPRQINFGLPTATSARSKQAGLFF